MSDTAKPYRMAPEVLFGGPGWCVWFDDSTWETALDDKKALDVAIERTEHRLAAYKYARLPRADVR